MSKFSHTGYIYFASPYSDPDISVRLDREEEATEMAAKLTELGLNLFCPITQSERLKDFIEGGDLPHARWMEIDFEFLRRSRALIVYKMAGWEESKGVQDELQFAVRHKLPILYLGPRSLKREGLSQQAVNDIHRLLEGFSITGDTESIFGLGLQQNEEALRYLIHESTLENSLNWIEEFTNREGIIDQVIGSKSGVKDSKDKARVGLIPYDAEVAIAKVREYGNKKYGDPAAWYQYPEREDDFVEAAKRHLGKHIDAKLYKNRSLNDEESGIAHLDHALASLAMAVALRDKPKEIK